MTNKYNADLAYRLRAKGYMLDPQHPWEPAELKAAVIKLNEAIAQLEAADQIIDDLANADTKAKVKSMLDNYYEQEF